MESLVLNMMALYSLVMYTMALYNVVLALSILALYNFAVYGMALHSLGLYRISLYSLVQARKRQKLSRQQNFLNKIFPGEKRVKLFRDDLQQKCKKRCFLHNISIQWLQ